MLNTFLNFIVSTTIDNHIVMYGMTQTCFESIIERERENLIYSLEISFLLKKSQVDMQMKHKCHNLSHKKSLDQINCFPYHIYTNKFCIHVCLYSQDYSKTKGIEQ